MKSYQQFFAELKRRKVFKVAGVYGVVAFGLIQVADPLADAMRLPDSFVPFVIALLLLGFPVALILAWAFEVTPDGVQVTEGAAEGEIEAIVAEPASRRWPAGLLALVGTAALLGGAWWAGLEMGRADESVGADVRGDSLRLAFSDVADDGRPSIAVLPFADMSPEGDQEYFSDGMTEEILATLANVRELRVSGRTSTFAYKGRDKDLREIGDELGVAYLVEGSVRKAGSQLRITAQLINASDGAHLWSETYDRQLEDVFAIQTEIAEAVARSLRVPLGLEGDERLVNPAGDLDGYDLYLAGRAAMRDRGSRLLDAVRLLEAAVERDSSWAPAWAALAEATELTTWYLPTIPTGLAPSAYIPSALDRAERAARRALELEPRSSSALVALGSVHRDRAEWDEAEAAYLRALAIDPDNAEAHQQYGELLLNVGRVAEAVRTLDRAAVLDPASIRFGMLGFALNVDGRPSEAAEVYELAHHHAPDDSVRRAQLWRLARTQITAGRWEAAIGSVVEANRLDPDAEPIIGNRTQVEQYVEGLRAGNLSLIPPSVLDNMSAHDWLLVGESDRALSEMLSRLEGVPFGRLIELRLPYFETVRSDPRVVAYFAERGFTRVEELRTPEAERTRPLVLREIDTP